MPKPNRSDRSLQAAIWLHCVHARGGSVWVMPPSPTVSEIHVQAFIPDAVPFDSLHCWYRRDGNQQALRQLLQAGRSDPRPPIKKIMIGGDG